MMSDEADCSESPGLSSKQLEAAAAASEPAAHSPSNDGLLPNGGDVTPAGCGEEDDVDARAVARKDPMPTAPVGSSDTDARPLAEVLEPDARPFGGRLSGGIEGVLNHVETDKESDSYNLEGPKMVIIFNHREFAPRFNLRARKGTDVDVKAIKRTFENLAWCVQVVENPKFDEVKRTIRDIQCSGRYLPRF